MTLDEISAEATKVAGATLVATRTQGDRGEMLVLTYTGPNSHGKLSSSVEGHLSAEDWSAPNDFIKEVFIVPMVSIFHATGALT